MGWASQSGRAVTNPESPRAFGCCDRCGFIYNLHTLKWQREWSGTQIISLGWLVCDRCLDEPQVQLKARIMPPDPVPVRNPRPDRWLTPGFFDTVIATEPSPRVWDRPLSTRFDDRRQPIASEQGPMLQIEPIGPPKPILPATPGPYPSFGERPEMPIMEIPD